MRYLLLIYGEEPTQTPPPEAGDALQGSSRATTVRVKAGERVVTGGPFAETREVLGGYYLIDVPDLDAALDRAARCPGAKYGSIEVNEPEPPVRARPRAAGAAGGRPSGRRTGPGPAR